MALSSVASTISKSANAIEVWRGQSKDIELTITQEVIENSETVTRPLPLTGATLYFQVRSRPQDTETLISKSSVVSGEITITDSDNGIVTIHLVPDDTKYLAADAYVFDVWIKLTGNQRYPIIEVSEFTVKQPVTVIA
jgi:hypothetical protein